MLPLRVFLLALLPLAASVTSTCGQIPVVPSYLMPSGFTVRNFTEKTPDEYWCVGSDGKYNTALVQLDVDGGIGPVVEMNSPYLLCINSTWYVRTQDVTLTAVTIACVDTRPALPVLDTKCEPIHWFPGGHSHILPIMPAYKFCPGNRTSLLHEGDMPFESIQCDADNFNIKLLNGTVITRPKSVYLDVKCDNPTTTTSTTSTSTTTTTPTTTTTTPTTTTTRTTYSTRPTFSTKPTFSTRPTFSTTTVSRNATQSTTTAKPPTTTTTVKTTTTIKKDTAPTAAQLWEVSAYYNYGVGVHAFCADSVCISAIQANGIGYDMVNGKVPVGKAVRESAIAAVRVACPTGSAQLRNLGFTKSGNKYLHNFSGTGVKVGWVAIADGACGARRQIKMWKSRYTDDMMYDVNLEWNTWYQGMVQDGGKVQFYMWD